MILMNKEKPHSIDKLYQQNFIERFEEFKDTGSSKPWVVELDPTSM